MADERYFNIPVQLIEGFLVDHQMVLNRILNYALYEHSLKMEFGDELESFKSSAKYFSIKLGNPLLSYNNGLELYESIEENSPKVGVNLKIFWDYYKNHKPEFDKACLLAYLALKSILQKKSYCKMDNRYLLARMDGKARSCEFTELSKEVFKYANEYQTKKIKKALTETWGLITYSHYTRGFYVSFSMKLEDLVFEAELKREAVKEKHRRDELKEAIEKAREKMKTMTRPIKKDKN